jgi:hypothetical protein
VPGLPARRIREKALDRASETDERDKLGEDEREQGKDQNVENAREHVAPQLAKRHAHVEHSDPDSDEELGGEDRLGGGR